jgi:hypothetical protein
MLVQLGYSNIFEAVSFITCRIPVVLISWGVQGLSPYHNGTIKKIQGHYVTNMKVYIFEWEGGISVHYFKIASVLVLDRLRLMRITVVFMETK